MIFVCIACLRPSWADNDFLGREGTNCKWCKSTARDRALLLSIHSTVLLKRIKSPKKIPLIIGISDGQLIERILSRIYKAKYKNFHYHQDPLLDITRIPQNMFRIADVISCSEVLEHVAPPINLAFIGLNNLLKPGGTLILSVPHTDSSGIHKEHYPIMKSFVINLGDEPNLVGELESGQKVVFKDLIFHGGVGATLEFRVFSLESLRNELFTASFKDPKVNRNHRLFGINWEKWSRVWKANKYEP
jgi:SAM-dependent methyltransferase